MQYRWWYTRPVKECHDPAFMCEASTPLAFAHEFPYAHIEQGLKTAAGSRTRGMPSPRFWLFPGRSWGILSWHALRLYFSLVSLRLLFFLMYWSRGLKKWGIKCHMTCNKSQYCLSALNYTGLSLSRHILCLNNGGLYQRTAVAVGLE